MFDFLKKFAGGGITDMPNKKVSVLMPVYNTEESYLKQAIESILNQTYTNFEFIIINDGSTNNSKEIIQSYDDRRIRYFEQENKGLIYTLNRGLSLCKGDYIARMDSDDISLPRRFEKQVKVLDNNRNIGIVGCIYKKISKNEFSGDAIVRLVEFPKYLDLLQTCQLAHPAVMFRRSLFEEFNLKYSIDYPHAEDYELWSRLIKFTDFYNIQELLLLYRLHNRRISNIFADIQEETVRKVRYNMLNFLTCDNKKQADILKLLGMDNTYFAVQKWDFLQKIFSVKNLKEQYMKQKIIMFLGMQFKFRGYEKVNIVNLMGGLGNQMFQYAFGKALKNKTGKDVLFSTSWFKNAEETIVNKKKREDDYGIAVRDYALDIFNLDIPFSTQYQANNCKNKVREKNAFIYDERLLKRRESANYEGYFQNEKYFKDIKEIIKKEFTFPSILKSDTFNQKWLKRISKCENSVFIHLRRGDYLNLQGWLLPINYYKKAVEYIKKKVHNPTFFLFGQDCEDYIKTQFLIDTPLEIIGETNSRESQDWKDMFLMQQCKHAIIANSTFSWWGAWLGKANEGGIVVAPSPFVNEQSEIICDNWVKIDIDA